VSPTKPRKSSGDVAKTPLIFEQEVEKRRVIVTAAQNATPVHKEFFASLLTACQYLNAQLIVIPLRYKNPTSQWTASQANEESWAAEVQPYLHNRRTPLNKNLVLAADVKTQPTATQPLAGFEALTHGESGILGHTKLALRSVPTPQSKFPKLLMTTGACTVANYTDSRAGKLGEFHHTLGAILVEIDGKRFHVRQLNGDKSTGTFQDLTTLYTPDGVYKNQRVEALVMGDTHVDAIDKKVQAATFASGGIVDTLKPPYLVWHDLLDSYAVNPHHRGDPFIALMKRDNNTDNVKDEVLRAAKFVDDNTPAFAKSVIVSSNHDDMLRRWVVNTDWRNDPTNARFYLETALAMSAHPGASPFQLWMNKLAPRHTVLETDESFIIKGIELGMHGDRGPNGARGSIKNLRRIGVKSIIGHSHSPGIDEGCYQVGTSTRLRLEYNSGPSSWLNTHCVIYPNGKRSLINIIDGRWKL
jgi:hypothetical protein